MLRILTGQIEQCLPDKAISKTLCPHIWIHYVMSGKGYYNGQLLQKGNAFIVYTGDYCEYYPAPDDPWKYIWIRIYGEDDEQLLEKCMFPKDSGIFYFSYFDKLEGICSYAFDNENKCELYLNENRLYAESLCKLILSLNTEESDIDIKESREKWVRRAKSYIRSNYHRTIKVEDIANMLYIDRKYLRNLFVQYTGESTQQYILKIRMRHAKELLVQTDASVGVVANSVGYTDVLCFSRIFKKYVGISPSEYRKNNKVKTQNMS